MEQAWNETSNVLWVTKFRVCFFTIGNQRKKEWSQSQTWERLERFRQTVRESTFSIYLVNVDWSSSSRFVERNFVVETSPERQVT